MAVFGANAHKHPVTNNARTVTLREVRNVPLLAALGVLSACGRAPQTSESAAPSEPAERPSSIAVAPTESSLQLKRGRIALSEERTTFRPCGTQEEWWVLDQTPTSQTQTFIAESQGAPTEYYIEAHGERAPAGEAPEAQGFQYLLVLEEVLYVGVPGDLRGCDSPPPTYVVAARGTEPFWSVEVHDQRVVWRQPEDPAEIGFGAPDTQNAEGGVRYAAAQGQHKLELIVHAQACRDGMSGEFFAYTAKAVLDGKEFNGCARLGE